MTLYAFNCDFSLPVPMLVNQGVTTDAWGASVYTLPCLAWPYSFTAGAGVVVSCLFVAFALSVSLVDFEPNSRRRMPLASADPRAEPLFFLAKTLMSVAGVLLSTHDMALSVIFALTTTAMLAVVIWLLPHREAWVNRLRAATFALLAYSSYVLIAVVAADAPEDNTLVWVEAAGALPAAAVGAGLVVARERLADGQRLLAAPAAAALIRATQRVRLGAGAPGAGAVAAAPPAAFDVATAPAQRRLHRQQTMARLLLRSAGLLPAPAAAPTPFASPEAVAHATRFVNDLDRELSLPDPLFAGIAREFNAQRAAAKAAAAADHASSGAGTSSATASSADLGGGSALAEDGHHHAGEPPAATAADGDLAVPVVSTDDLDAALHLLPAAHAAGTPSALPAAGRSSCVWLADALCCRSGPRSAPTAVADAQTHLDALTTRFVAALLDADLLFCHGLASFPDSAPLHLAYASFVLDFAGRASESLAKFHIDRARRLQTSFQDRFLIFLRDTERKQQAQSSEVGDSTMDLVSFVELQTNFDAALSSHRALLKAIRAFWRLVYAASAAADGAGYWRVGVADDDRTSSAVVAACKCE